MEQLLTELTTAARELAKLTPALTRESSSELLTRILALRGRVEGLQSELIANHPVHIDGDGNIVAQNGSIIVNINTGQRPDPEKTGELAGYLNLVYERSKRLDLSAIEPDASDGKSGQFGLDSVYVALMTRDRVLKEKDDPREGLEDTRPLSALTLLNVKRRLVLLGGPGSGKTTFVNYVALCLAGERLGKESANLKTLTAPLPDDDGDDQNKLQGWDYGALLPVQVVLRNFVAWKEFPPVGEPGRAVHLWQFLRFELDKAGKGDFFSPLKATLERRKGGLVLFDGLDEVPDAQQRRAQVVQAVQEFCEGLPHCRFLVTSRTYAYQQQGWQLANFHVALLAPLSDGQVRLFADHWYRESADRGRVAADLWQQRAELLKRAVFRNPRIRDLVSSPLLLTMAANLHAHRQGELPDRRHKLYEEILKMLLEAWERRRVDYGEDGKPKPEYSLCEMLDVGMDKVRGALQRTAYEVHASQPDVQGTGDVPENLLIANLACLRDDCRDMPRLLLGHLRDRSGILAEHGEGVYRFPHRSLQEYLAACHLNDGDYPDNVADLARSAPDRWREVALLAGAKAGDAVTNNLWGLADALAPRSPGVEFGPADHWGAYLAGQLLGESGRLATVDLPARYAACRSRLHELHARYLLTSSVLPARDRVAAAVLIPHLGEERPEALDPDAMPFCWVPAGPFVMGSDDDDPEADDDEKKAHRQPVDYGFWLARWPVTTAQFAAFLADEGYTGHDPDALNGPPGAPVVEVSWHDANAFCRWLDRRWKAKGWLPKGYHAGLPSELEWEKAARGGEQLPAPDSLAAVPVSKLQRYDVNRGNDKSRRSYPWRDEASLELGNYGMHIGNVSPVGCYPLGASPYGCEEMSGNVWEWTRSLWERQYPYPQTEEERRNREDPAADGSRVLRGGSFLDTAGLARCAARVNPLPGSRSHGIGFRVVLSPFTLNSEASGL